MDLIERSGMKILRSLLMIMSLVLLVNMSMAQEKPLTALDKKVNAFLEENKDDWRAWNIPVRDGQLLYDLIVENKYTRALEIGTSTGHSAIWMAWALSKTGGKLITIEIDENRYKQAKANFKKAGVSEYIDARLADAHQLVKELEGPFDFVFSDADKDWYTQYFKDVAPRMEVGGCFTAHNITMRASGIKEFIDYVQKQPNFKTTLETERSSGISISYKTAND
jgi:predicted O-methyltransferase YrrM